MLKETENKFIQSELSMATAVWQIVKDAVKNGTADDLLPWSVISDSVEKLNKIATNQKAGTGMEVLTQGYCRAAVKFLTFHVSKEVKENNLAAEAFNRAWKFIKKTQLVKYDDPEDWNEMHEIIRAAADEIPAQEGIRNLVRDLMMAAYDYAEIMAQARFNKVTKQ